MGDSFGRIIAGIIAVILMIFVPLINLSLKQDDICQVSVYSETVKFVDTVRTQGYMSPEDYMQFIDKIDATGNLYDVVIIHKKKKVIPVYTDPTDSTTFQNTYKVVFEESATSDIMQTLFPNKAPTKAKDLYYSFSKGDFIYVNVVNKNATTGTKLLRFINITPATEQIFASYGGMIRDSAFFN